MSVKVVIDAESCIGCGLCVSTAPDAVEFDADGKATVVAEVEDTVAEELVGSCPVSAISK